MTSALYVHVPFCEKICPYCAFYKSLASDGGQAPYLDAIETEAKHYLTLFGKIPLKTIFIGGGTPSSLKTQDLRRLLDIIHTYFDTSACIEKTCEMNPDSIHLENLAQLCDYGFNRISMGVQSFNEDEKKRLGRTHDNDTVIDSMSLIKEAGIENINIDLIFGLPDATMENLLDTLTQSIALAPSHISTYALSIEDGTQFAKEQLQNCDPDIELDHYMCIENTLLDAGFEQYEVSAFAKVGHECEHNLQYWTLNPYIGLGPSSSSFFGNQHYKAVSDINRYMADPLKHIPSNITTLQPNSPDIFWDYLSTGLRLKRGIELSEINQRFNIQFEDLFAEPIATLKTDNLISIDQKHIAVSPKGRYILNDVILTFMDRNIDNVF